MAQQALTAVAKLRGQADPVLAVASACLLLSLSMPDAHPSYLASSAAAVLAAQLLQARHDLVAVLAGARPSGVAATAGGVAATAGAAGLGSQGGSQDWLGARPGDGGARASLIRALQVGGEGPLGRHVSAELAPWTKPSQGSGPAAGGGGGGVAASAPGLASLPGAGLLASVGSHNSLVLLALVQATTTDRSRLRFAERVKDNLRKV